MAIDKANCENQLKDYETLVQNLDYSCKVNSDCQEVDLKYNSCAGIIGISKSVSKSEIEMVLNKLKRVREICGYLHPPCPFLHKEAYCNKGVCSERFPKQLKSSQNPSTKNSANTP